MTAVVLLCMVVVCAFTTMLLTTPSPSKVDRLSLGTRIVSPSSSPYAQSWNQTWGGTLDDAARDIATDADGNVYVAGESNGMMALVKYDPNGVQLWNKTWASMRAAYSIAIGGSDYIVVAGAGKLVRFDGAGNINWSQSLSVDIDNMAVAIDPITGNIYTARYDWALSIGQMKLTKHTLSGSLLWTKQLTTENLFEGTIDVAFYDANNIYVVYNAYMIWNVMYLVKYNDAGTQAWQRVLSNSTFSPFGTSIAVGEVGYVYVAGKVQGAYDRLVLYKYSSTGTVQWTRVLSGADAIMGSGVVVDPAGGVLLSGTTFNQGAGGAEIFFSRFNSSGQQQWNTTWGGIDDDYGNAMTIDENCIVYMAGSTTNFGVGQADMVVVKYVLPSVPAAPAGVQLAPGNGYINITWGTPNDGGSSIAGYCIFWSTDNLTFNAIDVGLVQEYKHDSLINGQPYYYKVAAINLVGFGANSTSITATPGLPEQLLGLMANPGNRLMNLTWSTPGDGGSSITGFSLYWSTDNAIFTKIDLGLVLEYQHGGLEEGQTYYYMVAAVNAIGEGANSSIASATTWDVPAQVTGLMVVSGSNYTNLTWSTPANGGSPITEYSLYWSTDNASFTRIDLGLVLEYQHGGLADGQVYYYKIAAVNAIGAGMNSSVASATTWNVPAQVTGLAAVGGGGQVNLTWSAPTDGGSPITGYSLYWSTDNASFTRIDLGLVLEYQHGGLDDGQTYYYKVAAVNAVGAGMNSSVVSVTTWNVPAQVTGLGAVGGNKHVNVTWSAPGNGGSPITGYSLYWSTDNASFTRIDLGLVLEYQHGGLADGQVYYYKIAAVNAIGEGVNSPTVSTSTWALPGVPLLSITISSPTTRMVITLSWTQVHGADSYIVYRYAHPITQYTINSAMIIGNTTTTTFNDTVPRTGTYWYVVIAVNATGNSEPSDSVSIVVVAPPGQDWVIIVIISVGIGAVVMGSLPAIKRRVKITKRSTGKVSKGKGYGDPYGKKAGRNRYGDPAASSSQESAR